MPTTTSEWLFWGFSVIFLSLVMSVIGNLITTPIKSRGENWLQKRRLRKEKYRRNIEELALKVSHDSTELWNDFFPRIMLSVQLYFYSVMIYLFGISGNVNLFLQFIENGSLSGKDFRSFLAMIFMFLGMFSFIIAVIFTNSNVNRYVDFRKAYQELKEQEDSDVVDNEGS